MKEKLKFYELINHIQKAKILFGTPDMGNKNHSKAIVELNKAYKLIPIVRKEYEEKI